AHPTGQEKLAFLNGLGCLGLQPVPTLRGPEPADSLYVLEIEKEGSFMRSSWKASAWVAFALLLASLAQAAESKEINQTIPLDRDGRLSIENFKGSISVTTWDRPEVRMGVRIDPDGPSSDPNEIEKVALTEVRVSGSGPSVRIQSSYDHLKSHRFLGIFGF